MATTMFIFSFVALCVMFGLKFVETHVGHFPIWTGFIARADGKVHQGIRIVVKKYQLWKKIAYLFFFEFLPSYTYEILIKMKDYVQKRYYESQSKLQGNKRMLRSNGNVSSFLQEISSGAPEEIREGKDEEKLKSE